MGSRLCKATGFILTTSGKIIIMFKYVYGYFLIGMSSMNSLTCMSVYRWILLRHEVGGDFIVLGYMHTYIIKLQRNKFKSLFSLVHF